MIGCTLTPQTENVYFYDYSQLLSLPQLRTNQSKLNGTSSTLSETLNNADNARITALFNDVRRELTSYGSFQSTWDGYAGVPFSESTITVALEIINLAENVFKVNSLYPADITPGPASDGTIDIEIVFGNKSVYFIIDSDTQEIHYLNSETDRSENIPFERKSALAEKLAWLFA